jgi:hypothetical protein
MSYLRDRVLFSAVDSLATDAPLRKRLANIGAYIGPRIICEYENEPILLKALRAIYGRLSHVEAGPGDEDNIDATTKRLSDEEARWIAHDIVSLAFTEMRRVESKE